MAEYANELGSTLASHLRDARTAMQNVALGPIDLGSILQLHGCMMKLSVTTDQIRSMLASDRTPIVVPVDWIRTGHATEDGVVECVELNRAEEGLFDKWFSQLEEFCEHLERVDLVTIDIFYPGLVEEVRNSCGAETLFSDYYSEVLAPQFQLNKASSDASLETLQDFLRTYHRGMVYGFGKSLLSQEGLRNDLLGPRYDAAGGGSAGGIAVSAEALSAVSHLLEGLERCRELLAQIVREHWTLREVAEPKEIGNLTMEFGNKIQNVHGSTIITQSLVQDSFNRVRQDLGAEVAEAIETVAREIAHLGNSEAAELFDSFNEEIVKAHPKKTTLSALWHGITVAMPTILQLTDVVARISKLF